METKHTMTPWILEDNKGHLNISGRKCQEFVCEILYGHMTAIGVKDIDEKGDLKAFANANLIVRAVNAHEDLLQACKASLAYLQDDYEGSLEDVFAVLKAAIAKSEGK